MSLSKRLSLALSHCLFGTSVLKRPLSRFITKEAFSLYKFPSPQKQHANQVRHKLYLALNLALN